MSAMKHAPARLWLAALAAPVLMLTGCQEEERVAAPNITSVRTVDATFGDQVTTVTLTGQIAAHVTTNMSFRVSGQVVERFVDVGTKVKAGQVLARLDPREQEADVEASNASVRAAEAQVRMTSSTFERQKTLLQQGFTTRSDYDEAETALRTANGSLDAARAQLDTSRDSLSFTELRAEFDGIVTARTAEVGQVAQAAQTMFTIARDGARDAIFDVYETLLFAQPVAPVINLALVSDPQVTAKGNVAEVSPTIDAARGTVQVKLSIDNPPERMTLGAAVTGSAQFAPVKTVVVPWTAMSSVGGEPAVWIVAADSGAVSLRPVTVEAYETGRALLSGGIEEGEKVVVEGGKFLRPGLVVSIVGETTP